LFITPHKVVYKYQHFVGGCCFHLQGRSG